MIRPLQYLFPFFRFSSFRSHLRIIFALLLFLCLFEKSHAQIFVAPNGNDANDGSTWEKAKRSILVAIHSSDYQSGEIVYVKEGEYTETSLTYMQTGANSNLPDGKNVFIKGGYSSNLTGVSRCNYNPSVYRTIVKAAQGYLFVGSISDGNLSVEGIYFEKLNSNNATEGKVLSIRSVSKTYSFKDVVFDDVGFSESKAHGAIYIAGQSNNNSLTITNCIFRNNQSVQIESSRDSYSNTISIESSVFIGKSGVNSRAIDVVGNQNRTIGNSLIINRSYFCSYRAGSGGAIRLRNKIDFRLTNSVFKDNKSTATGFNNKRGGGAILLVRSSIKSEGNTFINNTSGRNGGAILARGGRISNLEGNLSFKNDKFYENKARSNGGALAFYGQPTKGVIIENSEFFQNEVNSTSNPWGGAIYSNGSDMKIISSRFQANKANNQSGAGVGGAIKIDEASLFLTGSETSPSWFKNNESTDNGGAIEINDDTNRLPVYDSKYRQIIEYAIFFANQAGYTSSRAPKGGGALYMTNVRNGIAISHSDFFSNKTYVGTTGFDFDEGGGAIMIDGFRFSDDDNVTLFNNNRFGGNSRNDRDDVANLVGGSDIKLYWSNIQNVSGSFMQLESQNRYNGNFVFGTGNRFGGASPSDLGNLTAPTLSPDYCTAYADSDILSQILPPEATMQVDVNEVCYEGTSPLITFTGSKGTPGYTFNYTVNGGSMQSVTTSTNEQQASVNFPTDVTGEFSIALVSVIDQDACEISINQLLTLMVNSLPNNISSTGGFKGGPICQGEQATLTFDAEDATFSKPYTIKYTDGTTTWTRTINSASEETFNVEENPVSPGLYDYSLVSIVNGNGCERSSGFKNSTARVTVRAKPNVTVNASTNAVCVDDTSPRLTFSNADAKPIIVTYNINNGDDKSIEVGGTDSEDIDVQTAVAGVYNYNVASVRYKNSPSCDESLNIKKCVAVFPNNDTAPTVNLPNNTEIVVTPPPAVTGFNIEYSFDDGATWGANTPPTVDNCEGYKVKTRYVLAQSCGSLQEGNTISCAESPAVTRILDTTPPMFTAINKEFCVENIQNATYYNPTVDITPSRPEYYLLESGDTSLDLDTGTFSDNCCATGSMTISWIINFEGGTPAAISGTGQPSIFGSSIQLPGDGVNFSDKTHAITYRLTDCNGNYTEKTVNITIKPRPKILKMN